MILGENIRNIRKAKGLSIMKLRELTGLSKSTISDLENGKSSPTTETLEKIATALKINIEDLFREYPEPPVYDGPTTSASDDFGVIKESTIEKDFSIIPEHFTSPDMARAYVMKHQIFAASGFYPERMSDEDILNFANEIINQAELIGYKYKDK